MNILSDLENGKQKVMDLVKQTFKPEFLNRIDEIVLFNPLGLKVQTKIVDKLLNELSIRLLDKNISMSFTEHLKKYVLANGYSLSMALDRLNVISKKKLKPLSLLESSMVNFYHTKYIRLDVIDDKLTLV